jgi:hypothetical protein
MMQSKGSLEEYSLTTITENQEALEKEFMLMSSEERAVFSQIAAMEPPHSQRAQALLAIDEGTTQAAAGQQAGLTKGQVRYWLTKFRKVRIAIFPEELLDQVQRDEGDEVEQQEMLGAEEAVVPVDEIEAQKEDLPKAKKKAKKSKKMKKPKQAKKKKKGKKSSKKSKKKVSKKVKGKSGKKNKKKRKK